MDEFSDFFDFSKTFQRKTLAPGTNDGRIIVGVDFERKTIERENFETEYGDVFVDELREEMEKMCRRPEPENATSAINQCNDMYDDALDEVYSKYGFSTYLANPEMPIFDVKKDILQALRENQIILVEGNTGCGKSTQVPQFILDDSMHRKKRVNIVVAQPRRIGAISLAKRVCGERGWMLGTVVGYKIGLDHEQCSEDTRILYCTTGLLLEMLIKTKTLDQLTHIILDEVHERDKNMDFLFIVLKKLLLSTRAKTRIILMSATIDAKKFAKYFEMPSCNGTMEMAPIIKAERKMPYIVSNFYLDDLQKLTKLIGSLSVFPEHPEISDGMYKIALALITVLRNFDENVLDVGQASSEIPSRATVLVFLPGINEITRMHTMLTQHMSRTETWKIIILHSNVGTGNQQQIFSPVPPNTRKIILSTNIAESSITLPDVCYVIDFCLTKCMTVNRQTGFSSLQLNWAARSNCIQRSGRAGRITNGRCYRLVPRHFYEKYMEESPLPELIRTPLENVVLKTKLLDMGPPHALLSLAMDRPQLSDIAYTVLHLKEVGGLLRTIDGTISNFDGDLTFMGRVMANLPLDVRISRLILLGYCFSLLKECIIMGAGLNVQSIFTNSFMENMRSYSHKLEWSNGSGSDLIALLNVYRIWSQKCNQKEFGQSHEQKQKEKEFGQQHSVDIRAMQDCELMIKDLEERLKKFNIETPTNIDRVCWKDHEKVVILKVVIAGAFYPNMFLHSVVDNSNYERMAYHCLNGRDPRNTVYLTNFEQKYIRELYCSNIKELFADSVIDRRALNDLKVSFDETSEKVFVTFEQRFRGDHQQDEWESHNVTIPGRIATEVYKAVKMRKLRIPMTIQTMEPNDAMHVAKSRGLGDIEAGVFIPKKRVNRDVIAMSYPRLLESVMYGVVTHVENCDRFWFQPRREQNLIEKFYRDMNPPHLSHALLDFKGPEEIKVGSIVSAELQSKMLRGKVIKMCDDKIGNDIMFEIFFIDFGVSAEVSFQKIRKINSTFEQLLTPPRGFECCLAEIQPSSLHHSSNDWSKAANDLLRRKTIDNPDCREVRIKIYSLVYGTVRVTLYVNDECINDTLVEKHLAERSGEDYLSKTNHAKRMKIQAELQYDQDALINDDFDDYDVEETYMESVPLLKADCRYNVRLRGPFSPLESTIYSTVVSECINNVTIDPLSVNSVFLDNVPQEQTQKYIVGASVSHCNGATRSLMLRETTLMPHIRGFGPLMAMLFCPTMQINRDKNKSRYVSVLTGLGYDDLKRKPIYEEHDAILYMDAVISLTDIEIINQLRYCFDSLFYTELNEAVAHIHNEDRNKICIKIKELIINLLERPRDYMEMHSGTHKWEDVDLTDLVCPIDIYQERAIFPLHRTLRLHPSDPVETKKLRDHCAELHENMHQETQFKRPIRCLLCTQELENNVQLRIHVFSQLHLAREKQIGFIAK